LNCIGEGCSYDRIGVTIISTEFCYPKSIFDERRANESRAALKLPSPISGITTYACYYNRLDDLVFAKIWFNGSSNRVF
jgi:hypothetical protein